MIAVGNQKNGWLLCGANIDVCGSVSCAVEQTPPGDRRVAGMANANSIVPLRLVAWRVFRHRPPCENVGDSRG
jgi:hypothetical protein